MTFAEYAPAKVSVDPIGVFSDHELVTCRLRYLKVSVKL